MVIYIICLRICYLYFMGFGLCKRFCCCGSYENFENVDDIFNWFDSVKMLCSLYFFVGIIVINKNVVYYVGFNVGLLY